MKDITGLDLVLVALLVLAIVAIVILRVRMRSLARQVAEFPGRGCCTLVLHAVITRRRRPKAKYDSGPTPAELTSTAATIHIRFEPRIWLAGRRLMSMSTAVLRTASAIAAAMISLRLRSLRSLHRLAMTSSASMHHP